MLISFIGIGGMVDFQYLKRFIMKILLALFSVFAVMGDTSIPVSVPVPDFVKIEGGTFIMGEPDSVYSPHEKHNAPRHTVTVSSFYMSKYEITQREFTAAMGFNPHGYWAPELPVDFVNWYDAIAYCNALSKLDGRTPAYEVTDTYVKWNRSADGYRLPTEAEWEYACRAGTSTLRYWGDNISFINANYKTLNAARTEVYDLFYLARLAPGGSYAPNAFGLYEMLGNVYEWCWDKWEDTPYDTNPQTDPVGPGGDMVAVNSRFQFVLRGGCWFVTDDCLRSGRRDEGPVNVRWKGNGIRLVHN
jgi:formylglycine-generating enzyme required for sulfatase activity